MVKSLVYWLIFDGHSLFWRASSWYDHGHHLDNNGGVDVELRPRAMTEKLVKYLRKRRQVTKGESLKICLRATRLTRGECGRPNENSNNDGGKNEARAKIGDLEHA